MLEVEGLRLKRKEQLENKLYVTTVIAAKGVIPAPYQVRGRLSQARNDKLHETYVVMYKFLFLTLKPLTCNLKQSFAYASTSFTSLWRAPLSR